MGVLLSTLISFLVFASQNTPFPEEKERVFSSQAMEEYHSNPQFDYSAKVKAPDSFLGQIVAWVLATIARWFSTPNGSWLGENLIRVILLSLVIVGVFLLMKINYGKAMIGGEKGIKNKVLATPILEQNQNYRRLYTDAKEAEDWKLSIRYLYLLTLSGLQKKDQIKVTKWKTSVDYAYELSNDLRSDFLQISRVFEECWYGDIEPDGSMINTCEVVYEGLTHG